ncbi:unnamed protein product [Rangifer tarandus platyrhynchus]|uniref:Uncharacterized protein n=2 Tax=Rangifer tarandus platyrhynchus TaxID=3082113 RepID=A0ABN8ZHA1_RANTA|nr:unnamed protein product [Rangifer tarandus platyrhynchus]CAI9707977.1 unnamed protein product [Rangifer tarandus platyrhynchus]
MVKTDFIQELLPQGKRPPCKTGSTLNSVWTTVRQNLLLSLRTFHQAPVCGRPLIKCWKHKVQLWSVESGEDSGAKGRGLVSLVGCGGQTQPTYGELSTVFNPIQVFAAVRPEPTSLLLPRQGRQGQHSLDFNPAPPECPRCGRSPRAPPGVSGQASSSTGRCCPSLGAVGANSGSPPARPPAPLTPEAELRHLDAGARLTERGSTRPELPGPGPGPAGVSGVCGPLESDLSSTGLSARRD